MREGEKKQLDCCIFECTRMTKFKEKGKEKTEYVSTTKVHKYYYRQQVMHVEKIVIVRQMISKKGPNIFEDRKTFVNVGKALKKT